MTTLSPIAKLPRPELVDQPNAPSAFISLTNTLDKVVIPAFPSAAARDLALPAPTGGQHAWLTDSNSLTRYDTSVAGWRSYNIADQTITGLTVTSGFTLTGATFLGKQVNGVCTVSAQIPVTVDIVPSGSNITPDKLMCTLPVGYRPPVVMSFNYDNGTVGGDGIVGVNGDVTLRTASGPITTPSNIRFSSTFVL